MWFQYAFHFNVLADTGVCNATGAGAIVGVAVSAAGVAIVAHGVAVISVSFSNLGKDIVEYSKFEAGRTASKDIKKVDDSILKNNGIDPHELKRDTLGQKAKISEYDLYIEKNTGEIIIYKKGAQGAGIPTGE